MKKIKSLLYISMVFFICLMGTQSVKAAYFGVYDIRDIGDSVYAPEDYPDTVHFDWVNRTYTYQGQTTDVYFSIEFNLYAPNSWDSEIYGDYQDATLGDANLYSYYYQVTYTSSENQLKGVDIPYYPADLTSVGITGSGEPTQIYNYPDESLITVRFSNSGNYLEEDETSRLFYMTSGSWWGWQQLTYDANSGTDGNAAGSTVLSSLYSSPDGMIPAPNPEAPTVALYIVGLFGMGAVYYKRKRQAGLDI